jgi:hypothetical protein
MGSPAAGIPAAVPDRLRPGGRAIGHGLLRPAAKRAQILAARACPENPVVLLHRVPQVPDLMRSRMDSGQLGTGNSTGIHEKEDST